MSHPSQDRGERVREENVCRVVLSFSFRVPFIAPSLRSPEHVHAPIYFVKSSQYYGIVRTVQAHEPMVKTNGTGLAHLHLPFWILRSLVVLKLALPWFGLNLGTTTTVLGDGDSTPSLCKVGRYFPLALSLAVNVLVTVHLVFLARIQEQAPCAQAPWNDV